MFGRSDLSAECAAAVAPTRYSFLLLKLDA